MRTTIEFDDDTAAGIEQLRHQENLGVSEAVNELVRRGLRWQPDSAPFRQETAQIGFKIDVSNVSETLDLLEGSTYR